MKSKLLRLVSTFMLALALSAGAWAQQDPNKFVEDLSTKVIELLLKSFRENYPKIRFAIPSSTVRYRRDDGDDDAGDAVEKLPLS